MFDPHLHVDVLIARALPYNRAADSTIQVPFFGKCEGLNGLRKPLPKKSGPHVYHMMVIGAFFWGAVGVTKILLKAMERRRVASRSVRIILALGP